jgi:hypothetical protein
MSLDIMNMCLNKERCGDFFVKKMTPISPTCDTLLLPKNATTQVHKDVSTQPGVYDQRATR